MDKVTNYVRMFAWHFQAKEVIMSSICVLWCGKKCLDIHNAFFLQFSTFREKMLVHYKYSYFLKIKVGPLCLKNISYDWSPVLQATKKQVHVDLIAAQKTDRSTSWRDEIIQKCQV